MMETVTIQSPLSNRLNLDSGSLYFGNQCLVDNQSTRHMLEEAVKCQQYVDIVENNVIVDSAMLQHSNRMGFYLISMGKCIAFKSNSLSEALT